MLLCKHWLHDLIFIDFIQFLFEKYMLKEIILSTILTVLGWLLCMALALSSVT